MPNDNLIYKHIHTHVYVYSGVSMYFIIKRNSFYDNNSPINPKPNKSEVKLTSV